MSYHPERAGALCHLCPLRGQKFVAPIGPHNAELVIVGEAPGANELQRGEPFVGASGMKLNSILSQVGMHRSQVWISNSMLCRAEIPGGVGLSSRNFQNYMAWLSAENRRRRREARQAKRLPPIDIASPLECCRPRLLRELKWFESHALGPNGVVVMPLGNAAVESVTGLKTGVMKLRGSPLVVNLGEVQ